MDGTHSSSQSSRLSRAYWWQVPIRTTRASSMRLRRRRGLVVTPTGHLGFLSLRKCLLLITNRRPTRTLSYNETEYMPPRISEPQPVEVDPSGSSEASQQVSIEALPSVLLLHLKRFLYDTAARGVVNICNPVQFLSRAQDPIQYALSFPFDRLRDG